ncbi:peptidase (plasmid) [Clavibacter capsici]|uniref:Peptidase n=1 Tax=Clavibacter capsici TaxID=1874630 RepID=A0AAE6XU23_9MICO|nr:peptidase [Clavibacter capsici]QIS40541.1 peptidase [Clavibacter capsici]QIS43529.1 peptidase [Clavibacter capsici]QIS46426.1 peptidase [Clavibacter capsici]
MGGVSFSGTGPPAAHASPSSSQRLAGTSTDADRVTGKSFSYDDDAASAEYWTPERIQKADAASGDSHTGDANLVQSSGLTHYEPVYWIGRLYFTRGGREGSCTGSVVKSDSRLVVATAAHCLYFDGDFATNVRFIPAWDGANKPLLTWGADFYQVTTSWHASMDAQHDTAFIKMKPRENWGGSKTYLADVAGASRVDFALAAPRLHYEMFGYSQVSGYTPAPLVTCSGEGDRFIGSPRRIGLMPCQFPPGSSGGPVYHASTRGPNGTQVGNTSSVQTLGNTVISWFVPWGSEEHAVYKNVDTFVG